MLYIRGAGAGVAFALAFYIICALVTKTGVASEGYINNYFDGPTCFIAMDSSAQEALDVCREKHQAYITLYGE